MRPKRVVIMMVVVAFLSYGAPRVFGADPTLAGTYTAKGFNQDGSEYHRIVKMVTRGESFLVAWIVPEKVDDAIRLVPQSAGVGIANGDMLAVSFYGQDVTGIILYRIEDGGARLAGRWVTAEGDGAVRSETLTKVEASPVPATPDTGKQQPPVHSNPIRAAMPRNIVANP